MAKGICFSMKDYNVLDEIEELINRGYDEEHAEEVAMLGNYNIPLEDMFDYEKENY